MNLKEFVKENKKIDIAIYAMFFFFFCVKIGFNHSSIIEYGLFAGLMITVFLKIIKEKKFIFDKYNLWYLLFTFFCLLSMFWCKSLDFCLKMLPSVGANLIITFLFINFFNTKKKINHFIDIFIVSTIICAIKIIILFPFVYGDYNIASETIMSITGIAVNAVAQVLCFGFICLFYRTCTSVKRDSKLLKKVLYVVFNIIMFVAIVLTESRKSIVLAILGIMILIVFMSKDKKKLLKNLILIGISLSLIGTIMLIFNDNLRTEMLGLVKSLFGNNSNDDSINLRKFFIDTGIQIFKKYPVGGIGMNNFAYYVKEYTSYTENRYSHNNYIEILSNLGIIGAFIYYWFYAYVVVKICKLFKNREKNSLFCLSIACFAVLLIAEYAVVSYSSCLYQIVIFISYMIVRKDEKFYTIDHEDVKNVYTSISKNVKKVLNNDYCLSFIKKFINIIFGFLTLIFLNRYLGTTLKGEYTYILNYTTIISIIFQLGISTVYAKFKRKNIDDCYYIFTSISIIQFILYLIISLVILLLGNFEKNLVLIVIVSVISIFTTQIRYINLVEHYKYNSFAVVIMSLINFLAMIIVYLLFSPSIVWAFIVLIIKDLAIITLFVPKVDFKKLFKKHYFKYYKQILFAGFVPMIANLLIILNYKVDIIMLKSMDVSFSSIGLYSVGLSIAEYIWLIPEIFKDVMQKRTSKSNSLSSINFSLRISSSIVMVIYLVLLLLGKPIIGILFGSEYIGAYTVSVVLFIGVYSMIYYKIIGTLFIADNKSNQYFAILLVGTVLNIIANYYLIPKYEIIGAAIASVASYSIIGILFLIIYARSYKVSIKDVIFINKNDINLIKRFLIKKEN